MTDLAVKKVSSKIIIDKDKLNEFKFIHLFKTHIPQQLKDRTYIIHAGYRNCRLDFMVVNKENLKSFYIELKCRTGNYNDSLKIISRSKLMNAVKHYNKPKLFIILFYEEDNEIYYIDNYDCIFNCKTIVMKDSYGENDICYDLSSVLKKGWETLQTDILLSLIT